MPQQVPLAASAAGGNQEDSTMNLSDQIHEKLSFIDIADQPAATVERDAHQNNNDATYNNRNISPTGQLLNGDHNHLQLHHQHQLGGEGNRQIYDKENDRDDGTTQLLAADPNDPTKSISNKNDTNNNIHGEDIVIVSARNHNINNRKSDFDSFSSTNGNSNNHHHGNNKNNNNNKNDNIDNNINNNEDINDQAKITSKPNVLKKRIIQRPPPLILDKVSNFYDNDNQQQVDINLSAVFPKDSPDKALQNLIRENIYRQTIPCTTRPPKKGEVAAVDYHFLTKDQFVEMNNRGMLLECGTYGGHYYGTMRPFSDLESITSHKKSSTEKLQDEVDDVGNERQSPLTDKTNKHNNISTNDPAETLNSCPKAIISTSSSTTVDTTTTNGNTINAQPQMANPVYDNYQSLKMQLHPNLTQNDVSDGCALVPQTTSPQPNNNEMMLPVNKRGSPPSATTVEIEPLPYGWEKVFDQTYGTYYIDHNTQTTHYERPYEIELTKAPMGFGFTLVETDNGFLLVRSVIPGGPAFIDGTIRPGDIFISAVGVLVSNLQYTDLARLFSTFAVGEIVKMTFARTSYVVDTNSIVPDEYLFSNGSNGDMTIATNPNSNQLNHPINPYDRDLMINQIPNNIALNQEFEFYTLSLTRGDQGFGFTISDSVAGQKVKKIQNNDTCVSLKQGDILISLNNQNITKLSHKEVVEKLKNFSTGQNVTVTVKRKKRIRSKTLSSNYHSISGSENYSTDTTPLRNCKTPSLDGSMMMRNTVTRSSLGPMSRNPFLSDLEPKNNLQHDNSSTKQQQQNSNYEIIQDSMTNNIYGVNPMMQHSNNNGSSLHHQQPRSLPVEATQPAPLAGPYMNNNHHQNQHQSLNTSLRPANTLQQNDGGRLEDMMIKSTNQSDTSSLRHSIVYHDALNQMNQYNNFMHNDKLVMMQMQQQESHKMMRPPISSQTQCDYYSMPLYSNNDMMKSESLPPATMIPVPPKPNQYVVPIRPSTYAENNNSYYMPNLYANNEEIMLEQRGQYGGIYNNINQKLLVPEAQQMRSSVIDPYNHIYRPPLPLQQQHQTNGIYGGIESVDDDHNDYEYHQVDLDRGNTELNWGIRLIGGSEVDRAISIGSIVFGGVASKNGRLKSGDEIILINGINVVGSTHQDVVELISTCSTRANLVIRRKKFADACDVILTRNMDEGFGFVIISDSNCALIGRIIEGSPADRCQQLHVRDRIIAVNGRYITSDTQHPQIVNMIKECESTLRLRIIPADCYTVELIKSSRRDNFGFSMRGGSEYDGTPLYILRVAPDGLARDLLNVGDQIIEINNIPTVGMTHQQAATIIKYSDPIVKLKLRRNYVTPPSLLVDSPRALQKFNQVTAEIKTINWSGNNNLNHMYHHNHQDGYMSSSTCDYDALTNHSMS